VNFVLDMEKVRALAKPGHVRCHGNGISGYRQGGKVALVCGCVWRALDRKGVNVRNGKAVEEAIGKEKLVAVPEEKAEPTKEVGVC
jgi:hypothetical protein